MVNEKRWVPSREACKFYSVSGNTLRRWAKNNDIVYKRTQSNHRIYLIDERSIPQVKEAKRINYIYARVSSSKQKDDLERQCSMLLGRFPDYELVTDIGSGLNYKRRGLLKVLEQSNKGLVESVVVASKDRLCRFGFDLLVWQFLQNDTKLVVLEQSDKIPEQEFTEDILAILQVFACRWNGKRRYTIANEKNTIKIDINTEKDPQEVVR